MSKKKNNKIFRLLVLIILVSANTFAWFIYATKIDGSVSVHVKGWDVLFEAGENEVSNIINVNVDSIYPVWITIIMMLKHITEVKCQQL